jgi:hypothetical protein
MVMLGNISTRVASVAAYFLSKTIIPGKAYPSRRIRLDTHRLL